MDPYKKYLDQLKNIKTEADFGRIYSQVEARIKTSKKFPGMELAFSGALAGALIISGLYFNHLNRAPGYYGVLTEYLYQQEEAGGNSIMDYIFID